MTNQRYIINRGIVVLLVIVLFSTVVVAARLPTIGGDSDTWGTFINEYLNSSLGLNATSLSITGNVSSDWIIATAINATGSVNATIFYQNDVRVIDANDNTTLANFCTDSIALNHANSTAFNVTSATVVLANPEYNVSIGTNNTNSTINLGGSVSMDVVTITANTTLTGDHNIVLIDSSSTNITVVLPDASTIPGRTYLLKKTDAENDIIINTSNYQAIDGELNLSFFVQYDFIKIVSNGSGWMIIEDGLIPHQAEMSRDATQSIPDATETKAQLDTKKYDIGGIADIASSNFTIKRSGKYILDGQYYESLSVDEQLYIAFRKNGVVERYIQHITSIAGGIYIDGNLIIDLVQGDQLELYVYHADGAAQNSGTGNPEKPKMKVSEIRR